MGWRVWGRSFYTSDFSGAPVVHQPFIPRNDGIDFVLKAMRTWFIVYNNPTYTSIEMRIYSNNGGAPGKLIATSSNVQLKADLCTLDNGAKETWFHWSNPVALDKDETYHFVPWINGYTGDGNSHLSWKRDFPDPVNLTNLEAVNIEKLNRWPFSVMLIGGDL